MTGTLVKKNKEWVVKYNRGHEIVFYNLCENSKTWSKKKDVKKFIKEGIEVEFSLITNGFYDKNKQQQSKEFCAKLLQIEHSSI